MLLTDHEIATITTNNRPPPDTKQAANNSFRRCSGEELVALMNWSSTGFKPPQLASGEPRRAPSSMASPISEPDAGIAHLALQWGANLPHTTATLVLPSYYA
ncbi:hypothetical protein KY290_000408 [Solanum tuberosum]|uniref:Uncharacterized protein n=1 Tax=Solanum tuberosum TaxID=4113 RepID=A0ABQ7WLF1_SOLTU|nr:hypothetical protein KY284_000499 [Solanum tuberosum]KAH0729246.1 hypothetical protein KY289_000434 [Solanum tuberosum]KAH0780810.1 hypothetical protein KY290_000408 [Solanum tuberosum]